MPTRLWNCVVLMTVMVVASVTPMPSFAQVKGQVPTFELDRIIDLALERNPAIAGAQSTIQQNEGRQIQAGAYPNPTIGGNTGSGALRDPSIGPRITEYGMSVHQTVEWPGMRAARQDAAEAGLASATVALDEAKLNLIAEVKQGFYELLLAERTVDLLQQNLEIVQEVARIVRARVRSGEGPQFEAVKAEVEVLKAKQELMKAKNVVRVKLVGLDTLTAGALGTRYKVQGDFRMLRDHLDYEQMVSRDPSQHPTLKRQGKLVEQAEFYRHEGAPGPCAERDPVWRVCQGSRPRGSAGGRECTDAPMVSAARAYCDGARGSAKRRGRVHSREERPGSRHQSTCSRGGNGARTDPSVRGRALEASARSASHRPIELPSGRLQPPGCPGRPTGPTPDHRGLQSGALRTLPGAHTV